MFTYLVFFQDSFDIETHNKSVVMEERGTRRKIVILKTVHEFHVNVSTILEWLKH